MLNSKFRKEQRVVFLRNSYFRWVSFFLVVFGLHSFPSFAGNEYLELVESKMPALQQAYQEMLAKRNVKIAEWKAHRFALAEYPLIQMPGAPEGVLAPMLNHVNVFEYHDHLKAAQSLRQEADNMEWEFIIANVVSFTKDYSWAIPNDAAIESIQKYRKIIEIGAGTGYWAMLLSKQDVDMVAYDDGSWSQKPEFQFNKQWFDVQTGDETRILEHPDRTLMLCWPPRNNEVASKALNLYTGQVLIYIGEPREMGGTGTPAFFDALERDFKVIEVVDLPHWPGYGDKVYIYQRLEKRDATLLSRFLTWVF
jgi:hypothetical protein